MPSLTFSHGGLEFAASIHKVDRTKLYGKVDHEATDDKGETCEFMTLASDGMTLVPSGGTAYGYISQKGSWCKKSDLTPRDVANEEIPTVSSTLKQTTALDTTATIDEFLGHRFHLAYHLKSEAENFPDDISKELEGGTIYTFPFSYRGGLYADNAFLLKGGDGTIWMLVGQQAEIEFIGFEAAVTVFDGEDEEEGLDDLMDFGSL